MVILNGSTNHPHHRQNRRRERPGSRTRRTIHRKSNVQYDCCEGILEAYDPSISLPSDRSNPSPLLRQNFDQSWQRWKAREAEEKAMAELERIQHEREQQRLFGGDIDDDELYRMGLLYDDEDSELVSNIVAQDVPLEHFPSSFVIRPGRQKRRRSPWRSLPLSLSFSNLTDDINIARLMSQSPKNVPHSPTIQHRSNPNTTNFPVVATTSPTSVGTIPQSLPPPTSALSLSLPLSSHNNEWTFIDTTPPTPPQFTTPLSEPETWILLSDDS